MNISKENYKVLKQKAEDWDYLKDTLHTVLVESTEEGCDVDETLLEIAEITLVTLELIK